MSTQAPPVRPVPQPAWAPLRIAAFRSLWLALLASNIGTWMQTVGAQWLLVEQSGTDTLVAVVQTASTLPIVLLALPSGALADTFDRRRLLIAVQVFLSAVGLLLTVLTLAHHMPATLLLTLTFVLGAGQALTAPAWQAVIPELVPRPQLASASALGAISMNLARAVGPAVAGVLIARTDTGVVFGLNTLSFALFALVLMRWRPAASGPAGAPEPFAAAMRAGSRYVRHSPVVRRILLRAALFLVPGSALWALLPLVASRRLGLASGGYGVLLAAVGAGAVAGALLLPRMRARWSLNRLLLIAGLAFAAVLAVLALARSETAVVLALLPAGLAWVLVLSSVNAAMQLFLPGWVRARGLAVYQMVFAGAQAAGALAWGALSDLTGLMPALMSATGLMLAGAVTLRWWPMRDTSGLDREPAVYWPEPHLDLDPDEHDGPVLVTAAYPVSPPHETAFIEAMQAVRRSRLRTGAVRWGLFRDGEHAGRFVEVYLVPSWDEHLRQHTGRLTGADQAVEERARALADGPPEVSHLLSRA
ncbi:MFS transporter [Actinoplanes teichomyceticus]|uniref:Putative MFS family arabinose efflux permease n=1 Tax=Actinoplanes teichomyceticus TaxID=1867 RepID=A0A561WB69_ACTTI|nr:MFS transporter [Actinoplanes teichomyceticus]TWG21117.1 putative MFS family arabinose efflux permease [Actinoplanes teichomyceticus]GIF14938.1 MFS transporter [Actinoplanes teichomyceticus]